MLSRRWCRCCRSAAMIGWPARVRRMTANIRSAYGMMKIAAGTSRGRNVGNRSRVWFCE